MLPNRNEVQEAERRTSEEQSEENEHESLTTFKNAVIVGVRINELDQINSIDLNEISHQDPYVFGISSPYTLLNNQDLKYEDVPFAHTASVDNSHFSLPPS